MQDAFDYCAELVRTADRDRFIASLFAPAERRGALHALYAFSAEIARVREVAHTALPGEIRMQWWTDVVNRERDGEASANPVAAALLATMEQYHLRREVLLDLIEARRFDLYEDPMGTLDDLEAYLRRTSSSLFSLAALILAGAEFEAVGCAGRHRLRSCCKFFAPSLFMSRGASSISPRKFWSGIRCACTMYLLDALRRALWPRSPSCAISPAAI